MKVKEETENAGLKLSIQKDHGIQFHHFMGNRWGNNGNSDRFYFLELQIAEGRDCSHEIKRHLLLGRKAMTNPDSVLKSRDITLLTKIHLVKVMAFPVVMYGCESWTLEKVEYQELILSNCGAEEDSWESLDLQGNQPWIFTGRTDAEAEAPILWPPDAKSQFTGKDSDARKDWGQEKRVTEDEMVGWHHQHNGL